MKKKLLLTLFVAFTVLSLSAQPSKEDWQLVASNVKAVNFTYGTSVRVKVYVNRYNREMVVYDGDDFFVPKVQRSDRKGYAFMYPSSGMLTGGLMFYFNLPSKKKTVPKANGSKQSSTPIKRYIPKK